MKIADESNVDRGPVSGTLADSFNQKYRDQFVALAEKMRNDPGGWRKYKDEALALKNQFSQEQDYFNELKNASNQAAWTKATAERQAALESSNTAITPYLNEQTGEFDQVSDRPALTRATTYLGQTVKPTDWNVIFRNKLKDAIVDQKEFKDFDMEIVDQDVWNDETKRYEKQQFIKQGKKQTQFWDHPLVQKKLGEFGLRESMYKNLSAWGVPHYIETQLAGLDEEGKKAKFWQDAIASASGNFYNNSVTDFTYSRLPGGKKSGGGDGDGPDKDAKPVVGATMVQLLKEDVDSDGKPINNVTRFEELATNGEQFLNSKAEALVQGLNAKGERFRVGRSADGAPAVEPINPNDVGAVNIAKQYQSQLDRLTDNTLGTVEKYQDILTSNGFQTHRTVNGKVESFPVLEQLNFTDAPWTAAQDVNTQFNAFLNEAKKSGTYSSADVKNLPSLLSNFQINSHRVGATSNKTVDQFAPKGIPTHKLGEQTEQSVPLYVSAIREVQALARKKGDTETAEKAEKLLGKISTYNFSDARYKGYYADAQELLAASKMQAVASFLPVGAAEQEQLSSGIQKTIALASIGDGKLTDAVTGMAYGEDVMDFLKSEDGQKAIGESMKANKYGLFYDYDDNGIKTHVLVPHDGEILNVAMTPTNLENLAISGDISTKKFITDVTAFSKKALQTNHAFSNFQNTYVKFASDETRDGAVKKGDLLFYRPEVGAAMKAPSDLALFSFVSKLNELDTDPNFTYTEQEKRDLASQLVSEYGIMTLNDPSLTKRLAAKQDAFSKAHPVATSSVGKQKAQGQRDPLGLVK
jgi:hypothetical protein